MDIDEIAKRISEITVFSYQDVIEGLNGSEVALAGAGFSSEEIEKIMDDENVIKMLNTRHRLGR